MNLVDTMVVIGSDSLMCKDANGSIGDKMDSLLVSYIDEAYEDLKIMAVRPDAGYVDSNGNGQYDLAEEY